MNLGGWVFMTASITFVVVLCGWCFAKVLQSDDDDKN